MNDPGLDGSIANTADLVEDNHNETAGENVSEEEEERSFLMPARWWYASTAFPLAAGTFGPMANAFSICALVENWRVSIPKGGTEEQGIDIPDPGWLIAVNAVSLVFALTANLTLLLNMARRLSFKIAQPITACGFWIASVLLIALVAVASSHKLFHKPGVRDQALTQAYYYALFAAGLYQVISYMVGEINKSHEQGADTASCKMMFTIYGALKGHYSKEFKLTIPQRTLMLQTICLLGYLLLGALVYSKIEGWKFLDAVYWADFTLLTIGIGDYFTPQTHLGRSLLFPFAIGGIVYLGLVVGSIRSLVLERTKKKLGARMTEKIRRRVIKKIEKAENSSNPVNKILGLDKKTSKCLTLNPRDDEEGEGKRREAEFHAMRLVQDMAEKERKWVSLIVSSLAWLFLWMIGAVVFWKAEKNQAWTYFESIYFSYTTLLTIGYGDFQTISNSSKPFFVFWTLLAVPTLTILISNMGDTVIQLIKDLTIWLGEVTVLPSESGSIRQSLKFGLMKLTGGKINVQGLRDSDDNIEDTPPGLVRMPHRQKQESRHNKKDVEAAQKLASAFEKAEKLDEDEARRQGDRIAEDIHHYRHILMVEIRDVYADVNSPKPKKYTYQEWSYFLKLLGEDEGDPKYHRKALMDPGNFDPQKKMDAGTAETAEEQKGDNLQGDGQKNTATERSDNDRTGKKIKQWSWIGNRSPLMGDKEEAEWILEKLFIRLEEELKREKELAKKLRAKGKETGKKQDTSGWPVLPVEGLGKRLQHDDEDDRKTRASSRTLGGQFSAEEGDSRPTSSED